MQTRFGFTNFLSVLQSLLTDQREQASVKRLIDVGLMESVRNSLALISSALCVAVTYILYMERKYHYSSCTPTLETWCILVSELAVLNWIPDNYSRGFRSSEMWCCVAGLTQRHYVLSKRQETMSSNDTASHAINLRTIPSLVGYPRRLIRYYGQYFLHTYGIRFLYPLMTSLVPFISFCAFKQDTLLSQVVYEFCTCYQLVCFVALTPDSLSSHVDTFLFVY